MNRIILNVDRGTFIDPPAGAILQARRPDKDIASCYILVRFYLSGQLYWLASSLTGQPCWCDPSTDKQSAIRGLALVSEEVNIVITPKKPEVGEVKI